MSEWDNEDMSEDALRVNAQTEKDEPDNSLLRYCQNCGNRAGSFDDAAWNARGQVCDICLNESLGI